MNNKTGNANLKGRKAYNNGIKVIYLSAEDEIPEGFVKGGLSTRSHEQNKQIGLKSSITQKNNKDNHNINIIEKYGSIDNYNKLRGQKLSESKAEKFRQNPNYYKDIAKKEKETLLNKYGDPTFRNILKSKNTKFEKYGDENYRDIEKEKQTCLDRYGVPYPCMREEARQYSNNSMPNKLFSNLLENNNIDFSREFILENYSYDFKVNNILIEINPTATHNLTYSPFGRETLDYKYHFNKSNTASKNGYRCIHIFDWDDKDKIVSILKKRHRVYARQCEIKIIDKNTAKQFIDTYHLQGYAKDNIRIGLFYNNELVSIMTFDKPRYNKNFQYELIRYCSSYQVVGGAEKLFNYFIKNYDPKSIISYCDNSKFSGDIYTKLNFKLKNISIGRHWFNQKLNRHITDNLLRARGFDQLFNTSYGKGTSNEDLMRQHGFVEVFDAGQARYEWLSS